MKSQLFTVWQPSIRSNSTLSSTLKIEPNLYHPTTSTLSLSLSLHQHNLQFFCSVCTVSATVLLQCLHSICYSFSAVSAQYLLQFFCTVCTVSATVLLQCLHSICYSSSAVSAQYLLQLFCSVCYSSATVSGAASDMENM